MSTAKKQTGYVSLWTAKATHISEAGSGTRMSVDCLRNMVPQVTEGMSSSRAKHASESRPFERREGSKQRSNHVKF